MKVLARMYVWWPGINADIEKSVHLCAECQEVQSSPPVAPLHPWKWPTQPWACLHLVDFKETMHNESMPFVYHLCHHTSSRSCKLYLQSLGCQRPLLLIMALDWLVKSSRYSCPRMALNTSHLHCIIANWQKEQYKEGEGW